MQAKFNFYRTTQSEQDNEVSQIDDCDFQNHNLTSFVSAFLECLIYTPPLSKYFFESMEVRLTFLNIIQYLLLQLDSSKKNSSLTSPKSKSNHTYYICTYYFKYGSVYK